MSERTREERGGGSLLRVTPGYASVFAGTAMEAAAHIDLDDLSALRPALPWEEALFMHPIFAQINPTSNFILITA